MNLDIRTNACDPDRLESFLTGDLSSAQERDFTLHLSTCETCRLALERQAAEPEAWTEAENLLKPSQFDAHNAEEIDESGTATRSTRQPLQIQSVLDALGPTDDPQMLGRLGGYEVSGVVGFGGMGVVLKAIDQSLDRTVAIKVLAPHLATSGAARKRFAREAKAAAAVLHPNVIAIHSVSNDEALPYLVMPYVRGMSLQKRLDQEGPLSLNEILRIGSQIAAGLAAAHAQGLVHRDIKPANILLEDGVERVTITDFGLARAVDDATITHSGVIAGTPQYMSPEQVRGETVDQRNDLFSLGSVLYAICTGRPPFRADTTYGVMRRITDEHPTPIREINPDIPQWLCAIIARLMAKRAADRFGSAAEVTELLENCLAHVQQPAAVPLPATLAPHTDRGRWFSKSQRTGVVAMLGVCGFVVLGAMLWHGSEAPDITGNWTGAEWGAVTLESTHPGQYAGTYQDADHAGRVQLKWSRVERRFNGTWNEGEDRFGELSVRVIDGEIRGALTTDARSRINPATPRLADLAWSRVKPTVPVPQTSGEWSLVKPKVAVWIPQKTGEQPDNTNTAKAIPNRIHHFPTGEGVKTIACSADGKLIAVANGNTSAMMRKTGKIRIVDRWKATAEILDAETGKTVVSLNLATKLSNPDEDVLLAATERTPHFEITALAFSPDGNVVAVGTSVGQVELFDVRTGDLLRSLDDDQAKRVDQKTPEKLKSFARAQGSVASLAFSPDSTLLATCGGSFDDVPLVFDGIRRLGRSVAGPGRLKVWDIKTGTLKQDLVGHNNHANAVAFSPDGKFLASAGSWESNSDHGTGVILWDLHTVTTVRTFVNNDNGGTWSVAFSPDGKLLAIGSLRFDKDKANDASTGVVSVTHVATGIVERQHTLVPGSANRVAFSRDGKSLVALSTAQQTISFFDTEKGDANYELRSADSPHGGRWSDIAIATGSGRLAIGGVDNARRGVVEIWKLDGRPLAERFPYRVPFEIVSATDQEGGRIEIRELWGTRPRIEVGGQYLVRGNYRLPPDTRGQLRFYATAGGAWGQTASLDLQSIAVDKQEGDFGLIHGMAGPGRFHLILTDAERYSRWFADVYFGNRDPVSDGRVEPGGSNPFGAGTSSTPGTAANVSPVSRIFPLRFKLASEMADDLRQILLGRPGHEAKPSTNNQEITVTAPPDVMNRVQTFITVMDWPEEITRGSNFEYPRQSVMRAARSFFYACAIEDANEAFGKLLSLNALAALKGDTKSEHYFNYNTGGTPDAEWEKSLHADWPGKKESIQRMVREWNRYPLKRITEEDGVAIGFGAKYFCSISLEGAPKDFYSVTVVPDRTNRETGKDLFLFSSLPPWWKEIEK